MTIDTKRLATDAAYWDEVAPEGAKYYFEPKSDNKNPAFFARTCSGNTGTNCDGESYHVFCEYWSQPIPRPQSSETEWVDGLPPVGDKVEVWIDNVGYWATVTVLAVDVDTVVWRNGTDRISYIGTHIDNVRPIRTPEQRQREELHACISDAVSSSSGNEKRSIIADTVDAILSKYNLEPKP